MGKLHFLLSLRNNQAGTFISSKYRALLISKCLHDIDGIIQHMDEIRNKCVISIIL